MKIQYDQYEKIIVAFSGGKDSLACLLKLVDLGLTEKVELWHHDVDGREGSTLMDWPCTRSYCQAIAKAFGVPIYFSWKKFGFEGEMLRANARTAPTCYEQPDPWGGVYVSEVGGHGGKESTRMKFPQTSADLRVRWCSAYLKIDVCSKVFSSGRFNGLKTLFISGERGEESKNRSKYKVFEKHKDDARKGGKTKRHIDHYRMVKDWTEKQVWDIIERHRVNPHPAYKMGWGRVSCAGCIFGNKNQWASLQRVNNDQFSQIVNYEEAFEFTINKGETLLALAGRGTPYKAITPQLTKEALCHDWDTRYPVLVDQWKLPAGAYGESCGPT